MGLTRRIPALSLNKTMMEIPRSPVRISCQVDTAIMRLAAWPDNTGQATLFRNTVLGTNFA